MTPTYIQPRTGKKLAMLPITRMEDVLMIRLVARELASRFGFPSKALTQIATAVSEISRNVVQHSGAVGSFRIFEIAEKDRVGLHMIVEDSGCGITDLATVLADNYTGAGIPGSRKLMDEFEIQSTPGGGTAVAMVRWLTSSP